MLVNFLVKNWPNLYKKVDFSMLSYEKNKCHKEKLINFFYNRKKFSLLSCAFFLNKGKPFNDLFLAFKFVQLLILGKFKDFFPNSNEVFFDFEFFIENNLCEFTFSIKEKKIVYERFVCNDEFFYERINQNFFENKNLFTTKNIRSCFKKVKKNQLCLPFFSYVCRDFWNVVHWFKHKLILIKEKNVDDFVKHFDYDDFCRNLYFLENLPFKFDWGLKKSQLLFHTTNPSFLDKNFFRTDQMWLLNSKTNLISVESYKEAKIDSNLEGSYRIGRMD